MTHTTRQPVGVGPGGQVKERRQTVKVFTLWIHPRGSRWSRKKDDFLQSILLGHPLDPTAADSKLRACEIPSPLRHTVYHRVFHHPPNALIFSLVAQIPMRQLSLHVSALNDLEHSAYTEALHDLIADDQPPPDDYENVSVGAREVRAWLRGRYASMPLSDVDAVRSLFTFRNSPSLSPPSDPQTILPHIERP